MNAELPPFKNGEHNSENASTIDPVITPLTGYGDMKEGDTNPCWSRRAHI